MDIATHDNNLQTAAQKGGWETYAGTSVTIHARPGASTAERAEEELREVEQLVDALRKILEPNGDHDGERIEICLVPSSELARNDGNGSAHPSDGNGNGSAPLEAIPESESFLCIKPPEASGEPMARQLASHLIARWVGSHAASATVFVDGIAGLAAARSGTGPSEEEADQWVQNELEAGRPVSVIARTARKRRARMISRDWFKGRKAARRPPITGRQRALDPAATSFLAFLVAQSGPEALRKYLQTYDPNRQDQAAIEAYHQPLAVLQEEWLARLRRRAKEGQAFTAFLRQILPLLKPYKWKQLEILVYLLVAAGYNLVPPYAVKNFIDRVTLKTLAPFVLILLGIYLTNGLISLRRAYAVAWLNQNILNNLQIRMYAHLQGLSHSFHVNAKVGDIMARINSDLDNVQQALSQVTNKALYRGFSVVGAVTALMLLTRDKPLLAVPILCIIPLFVAYYAALRTRNKQASREQRQRVGQTMAVVQEHLGAHAVIKAFGLEGRFISDYKSRIHELQRSKLRLAVLNALADLSEDYTIGLAQLMVFGFGGYVVFRYPEAGVSKGDIAALLIVVKNIFGPIAQLSGIGQTIHQATGSVERVNELFQEPITVADKPGAKALAPLKREIHFENVTFSYGGDRTALRDLTLTIPAGSHVSVVGLSGSGKSSLINLILRFWDPEEGRILFDGHDVREVTLGSLRSQIGLVFQETFIFNTTLRANIAMGRPDATDAEIAVAAKAANLDRFIASLPAGYDTVPGEHGARLSVGQKQRIAIARTFLRNPPILILDEATSALDAKTEADILDTLSELTKGRTTISITHRISQASTADTIFVLNAGRLVEQGTHEELARAGGLYQKLYEEATEFVTNGSHQAVSKAEPQAVSEAEPAMNKEDPNGS